ncbi:MAG: C40 family peptidase [Lachnospiraceae bacterium]|nr:C40 family peptidase [Lachnospiraceae bacterium]
MALLRKIILGGCFCLSAALFYTGNVSVDAAVEAPTTIEVEGSTTEADTSTEETTTEETDKTEESKEETLRKSMVSYAKKFLGNRYVYGGTSLTKGTDCSGYTMRIYQKFGYSIPRTSRSQASASKKISSANKKPGDLIFYGSGKRVSHVAMYIGNGKVIHASNRKDGIKISQWNYRKYIKIGRFIK